MRRLNRRELLETAGKRLPVILIRCSSAKPASARPRLANTWRAWAARSPGPTRLPCSSSGSWPATKTSLLVLWVDAFECHGGGLR